MVDVLIIDDIQEIAGKAGTQNAFFNIFNHLQLAGKQIIMTLDKDKCYAISDGSAIILKNGECKVLGEVYEVSYLGIKKIDSLDLKLLYRHSKFNYFNENLCFFLLLLSL